ncbi:hypothetical protein ACRRTK_004368 [Alexandromys fortis]
MTKTQDTFKRLSPKILKKEEKVEVKSKGAPVWNLASKEPCAFGSGYFASCQPNRLFFEQMLQIPAPVPSLWLSLLREHHPSQFTALVLPKPTYLSFVSAF